MENVASNMLPKYHLAGETSVASEPANLSAHVSPKNSLSKTPSGTTASNLPATNSGQQSPPKNSSSPEQANNPEGKITESAEPASNDIEDPQIQDPSSANGINEESKINKADTQFEELIHVIEERVSVLENGRPRRRRYSFEEPDPDEPTLPCIPKLHRVKWSEFKNKYVGEKQNFAIEVLEGPAKYWYQSRGQTRDENESVAENVKDEDFATTNTGIRKRTPDRIRINSRPIRLILEYLSNSSFSPEPFVMLRPFKLLVHYEKSIRETLVNLGNKWGDIDRSKSSDQPPRSPQDGSNEDGLSGETKLKPNRKEIMDSVEALRDLRCLVEFIDHDLKPTMDALKDDSCQTVRFEDLWHIFQPGVEVYSPPGRTRNSDHQQLIYADPYQELGRVILTCDGRPKLGTHREEAVNSFSRVKINPFRIHCHYLDYNGTTFGSVSYPYLISPFEGEKDIRSLRIFPLRFAANASEIRDRLRSRGEKFLEFTTPQLRYCHGKTLTYQPDGYPLVGDNPLENGYNGQTFPSQSVDSEVIIDFKETLQKMSDYSFPMFWDLKLTGDTNEFEDNYRVQYWKDEDHREEDHNAFDSVYLDSSIDVLLTDEYRSNDPILKHRLESRLIQSTELREKDLILLPERVFGFILKTDRYNLLSINDLHPIKPRENLHNLKLPHGHKKTVHALVQSYFEQKNSRADVRNELDFVRGKGKSLVILLHGVSGVGKTATAEWVAKANGKPIFPITPGNLFLNPDDVELELREKFRLAELWDCILLLDEADVYLAQRSTSDLNRNSLVAIFLRALEYHSGIIFLTTNRVKELDYALKSRIDLKLYYPPLSESQTRQIWKSTLRSLTLPSSSSSSQPSISCDEPSILAFAASTHNPATPRKNWDARQIRNAVKTAFLLALADARPAAAAATTTTLHHDDDGNGPASPSPPPAAPLLFRNPARLEKRHFEIVAGGFYAEKHVPLLLLPVVARREDIGNGNGNGNGNDEEEEKELEPWPRRGKGEGGGEGDVGSGSGSRNWAEIVEEDEDDDDDWLI